MSINKTKVYILHLDLGIGGAERLIVDLAMTLLSQQEYDVRILTTHHDLKHCFEETKENGPLYPLIEVHGDWLPRSMFNGKFTALCGMLRMLYLSMHALAKTGLFSKPKISNNISKDFDLFVLDGISLPIPLLRLAGIPVLFYCHFPDKLLCVDRSSWLKMAYRAALDFSEEITTGAADEILVNSEYTAKIFKEAFPFLGQFCHPQVLYPVAVKCDSGESKSQSEPLPYLQGYDYIFLSINRYERKKNVELAINALSHLRTAQSSSIGPSISNAVQDSLENQPAEIHDKESLVDDHDFVMVENPSLPESQDVYRSVDQSLLESMIVVQPSPQKSAQEPANRTENTIGSSKIEGKRILLVVAGGYDPQLQENKDYLQELQSLSTSLDIKHYTNSISTHPCEDKGEVEEVAVEFRTSISVEEKQQLMRLATGLLYTPANEHFGIVPIEAMSFGCPVIAVNSGGPLETVKDGITGFLAPQNPRSFAHAMKTLMTDELMRETMREEGMRHVKENFSSESFTAQLNKCLEKMNDDHHSSDKRITRGAAFSYLCGGIVAGFVAIIIRWVF